MQSWMALLVAGMLIGPFTGATVASADTPSVPSEILATVDAAYASWHSSLGVRQDCSAGVSIVFEELDGRRGEYRTDSAVIAIDPSDDIAGMAAIVVHELSHHSFLTCGVFADADFRAAFYSAQGIPTERDWFDYSAGWGATPAEHFAEALAVTINGNGEGGIAVGPETVALLSRWLSGAPVVQPAITYEPVPFSAVADSSLVELGDGSNEKAVAAIAPTPQPEIASIDIELHRDIFDAALQKALTSVYWLSAWRVTGPI